jgi:hypothetical protein
MVRFSIADSTWNSVSDHRQFNYINAVKPALVKKRTQPKKRKIRGVEDKDAEDNSRLSFHFASLVVGKSKCYAKASITL